MIGKIKPFNSFGYDEYKAVAKATASVLYENVPLSGYLAGKERGGRLVCELEDAWAKTFKVKHAIACNSATSGLLAACVALGVGPGSTVGAELHDERDSRCTGIPRRDIGVFRCG